MPHSLIVPRVYLLYHYSSSYRIFHSTVENSTICKVYLIRVMEHTHDFCSTTQFICLFLQTIVWSTKSTSWLEPLFLTHSSTVATLFMYKSNPSQRRKPLNSPLVSKKKLIQSSTYQLLWITLIIPITRFFLLFCESLVRPRWILGILFPGENSKSLHFQILQWLIL